MGYHIEARDKRVGHVNDFIVDDKTWCLRCLFVDTRDWLPGRQVLVAPDWAVSVDCMDRKVQVDLTADEVKNSPEYDPSDPVNREYEARLYDYYGPAQILDVSLGRPDTLRGTARRARRASHAA